MSQGLLPAAIVVAAFAASPFRPNSIRETGLVLVGAIITATIAITGSRNRPKRRRQNTSDNSNDDQKYIIQSIEELRDVLPPSSSGSCLEDAKKVIDHLDEQMLHYISKSPLLYLATIDPDTNLPFVSPKGDEPGFVTVLCSNTTSTTPRHTLVIPDRPGNRLIFGLQNIVKKKNPGQPAEKDEISAESQTVKVTSGSKVSVLFEVPGTGTTLRCGGTAKLSIDPKLLQSHTARGCRPKLVILVDIDHAFFHCAKAYMRSKVWDPTSWPKDPPKVTFGLYFAKKDSVLANVIDNSIDKHYAEIQKAVDGDACEQEG